MSCILTQWHVRIDYERLQGILDMCTLISTVHIIYIVMTCLSKEYSRLNIELLLKIELNNNYGHSVYCHSPLIT